MSALFVGIDPGKKGAYAINDEGAVTVHRFPMAGGEFDFVALADEWRPLQTRGAVFVLEKAQPMPKEGVTSTFSYGTGYGAFKGILACLKARLEEVRPQAWKKVVLAGTDKDKAAAIAYVRRAYPQVNLVFLGCRVPHDGAADAACIAEFGRRTYSAVA